MFRLKAAFLVSCLLSLSFLSSKSFAQTHTPRSIRINSNCGGFYEYLPVNYSSTTTKYPLIIYIHGAGSYGNGSTSSLQLLLQNEGIPYYINNNQFPATFTVNGQTTSFVVITPQFANKPTPLQVKDVLDYAVNNYRVDVSRIYLTGYSVGGDVAWKAPYNIAAAQRLAALTPVAGYNRDPYIDTTAQFIAGANLPVWAIHSNSDASVSVDASQNMVNKINSFNPITPAIITRLNNVSHNNTVLVAYDPNFRPNGKNMYEWFLQYNRGYPPVANAGLDFSITLPVNSANLDGTKSSDPDAGTTLNYSWAKISGPSQYSISNGTTATPTVSNLVAGVYNFRLTVTDNTLLTNTDVVQLTVINPNPNQLPTVNAGNDQSISLPQTSVSLSGTASDPGGVVETYAWTKISGPSSFTITSPSSPNTTVTNLKTGTYEFKLTVTDNEGGVSSDIVQISVINPFPNVLPVARAGIDQTIQLPSSSVTLDGSTSSDADGVIVAYQWTQISGPTTSVLGSANAAITSAGNLGLGTYKFELKVTDDSTGVGKDTVVVTVNSAPPVTAQKFIKLNIYNGSNPYTNTEWNNWNPIASLSSGALKYSDGTASTASAVLSEQTNVADNGAGYTATMCPSEVARHASYSTSPSRTLTFSGLNNSTRYDLELYASRNSTASGTTRFTIGTTSVDVATDNNATKKAAFTSIAPSGGQIVVTITRLNNYNYINGLILAENVASPVNQSPVANAGADQSLAASTTTTSLNGSGSDPDGTITSYLWTKLSGNGTIATPNSAATNITGLAAGTSIFRLTVTDDKGASSSDDITVFVQSGGNVLPTANAGIDQSITLPTNTVKLTGSGADSDGNIVSYAWTKQSGGAATIATPNAASTDVNGLTQGVYVFNLTVTDNSGGTAVDGVQITVNPGGTVCAKKIVIVGSSTAAGQGAEPLSNSWANLFTANLQQMNANNQVINIAMSGQTTYNILPTGTVPPANRPAPNNSNNITAALAYKPDAIIINMPSNDAGNGYTIAEQQANWQTISAAAASANVPVWITTTQPRNLDATGRQNLITMRDWITTTYGVKSIDFWTTIANADGTINTTYSWGDGIHVNNAGHQVLYDRTVAKNIMSVLCGTTNQPPSANAGIDQVISLPASSASLTGSGTDTDGSIVSYGWTQFSGAAATINSPNAASTTVSGLTTGTYVFRLTVTDNSGNTAFDDVSIQVNAQNQYPVANAGTNQTITLPVNSVQLNAGASYDPDGTIVSYNWVKQAGPASHTFDNAGIVNPFVSNLVAGTYVFRVNVTDNSGASTLGDVIITVNPATTNQPPVANAGTNQTITLPVNSVQLNAGASYDPDGTIASYNWVKQAGPASHTFDNAGIVNPLVSNLVAGTYIFRVNVTDNSGASTLSDVTITVNPATSNQLPVANAGNDQVITLPANSVSLSGSGTDNDGFISGYSWVKISGGAATISTPGAASTAVTGLVAGSYVFRLTVTDNNGGSSFDDVNVKVNEVPVANAGTDRLITLPANSVSLTGSGSDADGSISTYAWTRLSGSGTIATPGAATTSITGLTAGTSVFRLTVTDNNGATGFDDVNVVVNQPPVANAGSNQSITLPVNSVQLSAAASSDPEGGALTYAWSKISGPTSFSFNSTSIVNPVVSNLAEGTYVFRVTVTDNANASATSDVTVVVNPATTSAGTRYVKVNIYNGTNPYTDVEWNNWNVLSSLTLANPKYHDGTTSTVRIVMNTHTNVADNGTTYNTTMCPPAVGRYASYHTADRTLTISGLDNTKTYNLELYASRNGATNNTTRFVIGTVTINIVSDNNLTNKAVFNSISPSAGQIVVNISKLNAYNYINGFILTELAPVTSTTTTGRITEVSAPASTVGSAEVFPNPVKDGFLLQVDNNLTGQMKVEITDMNGVVRQNFTLAKTRKGITKNYLPAGSLASGIYFMRISIGNWKQTVRVSKI